MQNVITAASFGVNLLQAITPDNIPFKKAVQTAHDYSGAALLALTAVATSYSYVTSPKSKDERHTRLTHVHTLAFVMIPTLFFGLETWRPILHSANFLKDYLYLPIHGYHYTIRAAASVGMGALLAWQEGNSLRRAAFDTLFNFALGGLPLYRLISNSLSKTNFVSRSIVNLGAMKRGEILAEGVLSVARTPELVQTEREKECAAIQTFKFLECDTGPISRAIQTGMSFFRNRETTIKIEQICSELNANNPCI